MEDHEIIPDVIDSTPNSVLAVQFESISVNLGNLLTIKEVSKQPTKISWPVDPAKFYTLCFTDPDAPSRREPEVREWVHWLVVNIPGENLDKGDTLTEFVPSSPGEGSGLHRYTFLVYEQPGIEKLKFDEQILDKSKEHRALRRCFSIRQFALKYAMGEPLAVNFFQTEWDHHVAVIRKELGLD